MLSAPVGEGVALKSEGSWFKGTCSGLGTQRRYEAPCELQLETRTKNTLITRLQRLLRQHCFKVGRVT